MAPTLSLTRVILMLKIKLKKGERRVYGEFTTVSTFWGKEFRRPVFMGTARGF